MRSDRLDVAKHTVVKSLRCGDLFFEPGDRVDAAWIDFMTYAVFLSNGWWAVDARHFDDYCPGMTTRGGVADAV